MAITLGTTPLADSASNSTASRPVNQRLIYTATSDNYTENGFRFVVNVTSSFGTPELDETFYIPASPSGEMILDLHDLLSKKLQYEQSAESVHFLTDLAREKHLGLITVSIKEGYIVSGVFTIDDATEEIASDLFVFWGAYDGATGPYPPVSTFQMNSTSGLSSRALSDRKPSTLVWDMAVTNGLNPTECIFIPVRQTDFGVLQVLPSIINDVTKVLYSITDDSGSYTDSIILNGHLQEVVPCYPANLNGGSLVTNKPADYIGWKYYSMQFAASDDTPLSAKYVFYPIEENCDHRNIRLAWRGHRGGWDYYNFQLKNFFSREVGRNRFQRGYSGVDFTGQTRREYERQMKVDRFLDISTDFIDDEEKALLQWLIQSPDVRIIRDNGTSIPVLVETNSMTGIAKADAQPLEQVLIRLKYAGDELNFNGWFVDESEAGIDGGDGGGPSTFYVGYSGNFAEFYLPSKNFSVDWGDGSAVETYSPQLDYVGHSYATSAMYGITITVEGTSGTEFWMSNVQTFSNASFNLSKLVLGSGSLSTLDISAMTKLTYLDVGYNQLSSAELNTIVGVLDANNKANGYAELRQTPTALISGDGITAVTNLITKGWSVNFDS